MEYPNKYSVQSSYDEQLITAEILQKVYDGKVLEAMKLLENVCIDGYNMFQLLYEIIGILQEVTHEQISSSAVLNESNSDHSTRMAIQDILQNVKDNNIVEAIKLLTNVHINLHTKEELIGEIITKLHDVIREEEDLRDQATSPGEETSKLWSANDCETAADYTNSLEYNDQQLALVENILSCKNFYQILQVSHDATVETIKKSYKKLALKLHPDKNHAPGANDAFQMISKAVIALTDESQRYRYDESGANSLHLPQERRGRDRNFSTFWPTHRRRTSVSFNPFQCLSANWWRHWVFERVNVESTRGVTIMFLLICVITFSVLLSQDAVYNLAPSRKFSLERHTERLGVPYYVKQTFESDYRGSMKMLEDAVEEDYIITMRNKCFQERGHHEIDDLIEKLKTTSVSPTNTADNTTTILCEISATKDPKLFDKHELAEFFLKLAQSEDVNIRKEAAKCIAEITKSEVQRKKFTKRDIIKMFIDCLSNVAGAESMELPIQICRALGNICYLNDEARDIILELKGDVVLIQLLDIMQVNGDPTTAVQFIKVRGGLLSNYLLGGEGLAKRAMELNIMQKIQNIITVGVSNVEEHEDLLLNTLPLLSILTENVADLSFDTKLNTQLSRILAASTNPDLAEMCLELLHYQAESDDVKLLLAKDGLCETIYKLLEKYKTLASTSEARALMKLACELIVVILTGDESMHFLYSTPLLKNMEDWLDSQDNDLLTTGVLALGNFARTDSHCIYMVEHKIMNKLLEVLAKNNGVKDDVRLQHALLSALRNLVIPKPNKDAVIEAGLVDTILPMLEIHQPPVLFKLLGTLRMTVDGQEKLALELLKNKTLIEQLVHWSKSSDYAGVTGESLRLMAWLIKHAYLCKITYTLPRKGDAPAEQFADKLSPTDYDRSSLKEFISNEGTIEAMINMLISQHLVMQNEALIALCILSVVYLTNVPLASADGVNLQAAFIKYEVGKKLAELIQKSSDTMTKEIVENLQNFTNLLKTSEQLVAHLEQHNINELLKSIPILTEYCTL